MATENNNEQLKIESTDKISSPEEIIVPPESSIKKDVSKNLIIRDELPGDRHEVVEPETNIRDIKDFIEVLDSAPTHVPKNFFDQIKIYNDQFYTYDYVTQTWSAAGGGYTDRGDPSAYDLAPTRDGSWRDWDISSIVPAGTTLVKVKAQLRGSVAGAVAQMRMKGIANAINEQWMSNLSANNYIYYEPLLPLDSARTLQYNIPSNFNVANLVVLGWW